MNQHIVIEAAATLMERERKLEMEMAGLGRDRFLKILEDARKNREETSTPGAYLAMQRAIDPMAAAIVAFLEAGKKKRGPRSVALQYLSRVPAEIAAFITAKVILDSITSNQNFMKTALAIGQALEDENRFAAFSIQQPDAYSKATKDLFNRTSSTDWRRKVLIHEMNKSDAEWQEWEDNAKIHLGQNCIRLFIEATGMVKEGRYQISKREKLLCLEPTPACLELMTERNKRWELLSPSYLPTVMPPAPWTAPDSGGYWFLPRTLPFIKTRNKDYLRELKDTPAMSGVYEAVNAMQETAWKVNTLVLSVMREVWDRGAPLGGIGFKVPHPMPPCPGCKQEVDRERRDHACFEDDKAAHREWKRAASEVHNAQNEARSNELQFTQVLWVAEKFKDEPAIYFPTQLDFRGRAYPVPQYLNPQGADWCKGLLTFAQGKPIADERAAGWLMIHGANTFGFDKVSLEDRVGWVEENEAAILACAEDPLAETFWSDADKPWEFLAFCFDYAAFKAYGFGYVSSLPVALDGSCNGLQHFSAMLRDPIGGAAVNLLPSEKPNDIYQAVCDRFIEKLKADGSGDALAWLALNPDRKLTKQPVMTMPYGATQFRRQEQVEEWLNSKPHSFGARTWEPVRFATNLIWQAIGEVVVSAKIAMSWLQSVARVAAAEGRPVRWIAPDGLPILQAYPETKPNRVGTRLGDSMIRVKLLKETGKLDKAKQTNGISPNFVHSMDAAALRLYVLLAKDNGISSFALVHDSYGTLAADTDMSGACLREAFVNMYQNQNHLEALRASLAASVSDSSKLPPVPTMGDLNLEQVRKADYFFA